MKLSRTGGACGRRAALEMRHPRALNSRIAAVASTLRFERPLTFDLYEYRD